MWLVRVNHGDSSGSDAKMRFWNVWRLGDVQACIGSAQPSRELTREASVK